MATPAFGQFQKDIELQKQSLIGSNLDGGVQPSPNLSARIAGLFQTGQSKDGMASWPLLMRVLVWLTLTLCFLGSGDENVCYC